jgi:GT2 family glycosyltransferase
VDANEVSCVETVQQKCPNVKVILSEENMGRNKLLGAARFPLVASFDDDSFPIDLDYFERAKQLANIFPDASILSASLYHPGEPIRTDQGSAEWVADFVGAACVYRRDTLLTVGGYVPLPIAYAMEEADIALRLHAAGSKVLRTPWLRVFHNTDRARHANARLTAGGLANVALLPFLRYPLLLLPLLIVHVAHQVVWLLCHGRISGIVKGLCNIPGHLLRHYRYRKPESLSCILSYRRLRKHPQSVSHQKQQVSRNYF